MRVRAAAELQWEPYWQGEGEMKNWRTSCVLSLALFCAGGRAGAERAPVLVELFTPRAARVVAADRLLEKLDAAAVV